MDLAQITTIINLGESHTAEFKKSTAQLKSACETACAFLNGDGGTIIFGVTDKLKIVGQEVSEKTKRDIGNELSKITPLNNVVVSYMPLPENHKYLIIFYITTDSTKRPYMYDGKAFMRSQSNTIQMPSAYVNQLAILNADGKSSWENQTPNQISLNDLDEEKILLTIHEGTLNGRIPKNSSTSDPIIALQRLGLIENGRITNAAMVLFGKDLNNYYPQCVLKLARFRGINKSEFIDNKRIHGNIFKLLDIAMDFASNHLPIASTFSESSFYRIDMPLFPMFALREAIANALVHRDYSYSGGSVSFAIYDDRIEIWNYGLLPHGVLPHELKTLGRSIPRNHKIANVLYYHKIFESWGRGVQLVVDACIEAGHPEPFYNLDPVGTLLTIPSKQLIGSELILETDFVKLTKREKEILDIVSRSSLECSISQIIEKMATPPTDRTLRRDLNNLEKNGYIEKIGDKKKTIWRIVRK